MLQYFLSPPHDEDIFEVTRDGVYVYMTMETGVVHKLFFTHDAITEMYNAIQKGDSE